MTASSLRAVPDTNVVLAAEKSSSPSSPNREYFERWKRDEFVLLYSEDTLLEYIEKLREKGFSEDVVKTLLVSLLRLGTKVSIEYFHLPVYPADADDAAFLLCAHNGEATHVVTYDRHLLDISPYYPFEVCGPVEFLRDLRQALIAEP